MKIGHAEKQKGKRRGVIGGSCSRGSRAALAATAKLFQQQPEARSRRRQQLSNLPLRPATHFDILPKEVKHTK